MKKIIVGLFLTVLFFASGNQAYACINGNILSPDPSYKGVDTQFFGTGTINGGSTIGWMYGYQTTEHDFSVDIPGWTCNNAVCTGAPYTGTYTMSIWVNEQNSWGARLYSDVEGQCPFGYQTVIDQPTPTPTGGAVYTANSAVMSAGSGLMGSFVSGYMGIIPVAIGIVAGLMVTLFLVRKLIKWVRGNMYGSDETTSFETAEKWWYKNHDKYGESYHNDSSTEIVNLYNKHHKKKARE